VSEQTAAAVTEAIRAGAAARRGVNERTAVYWFHDANDVLIYVGVTKNIGQRWGQHKRGKSWWHQVARREVTWFDNRPDALLAERRAVLAVLRASLTPMPEAETFARRRWAVVFAARVGWSKYQIAAELGIKPPDVTAILMAARRDRVKGTTVDAIISSAEREDA
jgi:hypothetical protein